MYFPKPYPDELMGSLIIRASHHLGLSTRRFGPMLDLANWQIPSCIFPRGLARLATLCAKDASELLWEHTLFPYVVWAPHLDARKQLKVQELTDELLTAAFKLSRVFPNRLSAPLFRKLCPVCASEEYRDLGETYWHRIHALPGVLVCPLHHVRLHITRIPLLKRGLPRWDVLPHETHGRAFIEPAHVALLSVIADASTMILRGDYFPIPHKEAFYRLGYRHECAPNGLNQFSVDFETFFGRDFLRQIDVPLTRLTRKSWPIAMAATDRAFDVGQPQLRWILIDVFLAARAAEAAYSMRSLSAMSKTVALLSDVPP